MTAYTARHALPSPPSRLTRLTAWAARWLRPVRPVPETPAPAPDPAGTGADTAAAEEAASGWYVRTGGDPLPDSVLTPAGAARRIANMPPWPPEGLHEDTVTGVFKVPPYATGNGHGRSAWDEAGGLP